MNKFDKKRIIQIINDYIKEYSTTSESYWRSPLVGLANASSRYFRTLKKIVDEEHQLPQDIVKSPTVVISYFLPFKKEISIENSRGRLATGTWAKAYEDTNALFDKLNEIIIKEIRIEGFDAKVPQGARIFDRDKVISRWSQRHVAYLAGLGTFGLNNMLITEKGCCGRYNSLVTNLPLSPDRPMKEELCFYKSRGKCGLCIKKCPSGALSKDVFDRKRCFELCIENSIIHTDLGNSYAANSNGSEVCGKCIAGMPCAYMA